VIEAIVTDIEGTAAAPGAATGQSGGRVYPDVGEKLRDWYSRGFGLYVYSAASVAAQRLLFAHTAYGDLTSLFSGYFDPGTGSKRESASYKAIARQIGPAGTEILFLSDTVEELDAAQRAGFATRWLVRSGEPDLGARHVQVRDFYAIDWLLLNN
jgi:enolase-phosphatase E1